MGNYVCQYCHPDQDKNWYPNTSSEEVILTFDTGNSWILSNLILHYVWDHNFLPQAEFVRDVMNHELILDQSEPLQSQEGFLVAPTEIGYLTTPDFPTGQISKHFIARLEFQINGAIRHRNKVQTQNVETPNFRDQTK